MKNFLHQLRQALQALALAVFFAAVIVASISASIYYGVQYVYRARTDTAYYAHIVAQRKATPVVPSSWNWNPYTILPQTIEPQTEAAAFFFEPLRLFRPETLSLRLRLPIERVEAVRNQLETSGRQLVEDNAALPSSTVYPPFSTTEFERVDMKDIPKDFRVYLYEPDGSQSGSYPPGNCLAFTAVSAQRREVVYYIVIR